MGQVLQVIGAVMILAAFAGAQFRMLDQRSYWYLVLNFIGSGILAVLAFDQRQWGFVLLETVWALVSLFGLFGRIRSRPVPAD